MFVAAPDTWPPGRTSRPSPPPTRGNLTFKHNPLLDSGKDDTTLPSAQALQAVSGCRFPLVTRHRMRNGTSKPVTEFETFIVVGAPLLDQRTDCGCRRFRRRGP
jgi:hypothetical protein